MGVRRIKSFIVALILSAFGSTAISDEIAETFSSTSQWDLQNSTAILNFTLGIVHPTLYVNDFDSGSGADDKSFDVGDGHHGAFTSARYSSFGTVTGTPPAAIIEIDTDSLQELNVTEFNLENGYTLKPIGSRPLVIKSLSDITISGVIDCSGSAGSNGSALAAGSGGTGRCGGGDGGIGSSILATPASNGVAGGAGIGGGVGGTTDGGNAGNGGGGGGAYSIVFGGYTPIDGEGSVGSAGTHGPNDDFSNVDSGLVGGGGSGGGGGGAGSTSLGAGGGAGGGVILLYAVRDIIVDATGEVRANGGNGGILAAGNGGAGGGGGGGSILFFAGRTIDFLGASGPPYRVTANKGTAPVSNGKDGGAGGEGRTWLVDGDDAGAQGVPNGALDDPISNLTSIGKVQFDLAAKILLSKVIDLNSTKTSFNALSAVGSLVGGSTLTIEARGSNDNFVNSDSGWILSSGIAALDGYRYLQLRLTLDNNDGTNYASVDSLTLDYTRNEQKQFEFVGACGRIGTTPFHLGLFAFWILGFYIFLRKRTTILSQ